MKKLLLPTNLLILFLLTGNAHAQDVPPVPAVPETPPSEVTGTVVDGMTPASGEAGTMTEKIHPAPGEPSPAADGSRREMTAVDYSGWMISFFEGLEKLVSGDDCKVISKALQDYCTGHRDWIDSLDYAEGNIDAETIRILHEKAVSLGKKLSVCYDDESIPSLLRRYAGIESSKTGL